MRVILCDKDPYELQSLQAGLAGPDRDVLIVEDGENVITLAKSRAPEVVVVGASLGQMGGFAVSRKLKMLADDGAIGESKVIILLEREADAWLANWSRCDAWLVKPVDPAELEEMVLRYSGQPAL